MKSKDDIKIERQDFMPELKNSLLYISYTLGREYRVMRNRYSRLLLKIAFAPICACKNNRWIWRHGWKSLVNRITSDPKIVIHGNECIILFLTRYFMSLTHNFRKTIIDRSFRNCRQGRSFLTRHCDVTTVDMCRHKMILFMVFWVVYQWAP